MKKKIGGIVACVYLVLCFMQTALAYNGPVRAAYSFELNCQNKIEFEWYDPYRHSYMCDACPSNVAPKFSIPLPESQQKAFKLSKIETFNNYGQLLECLEGSRSNSYSLDDRKLNVYSFNSLNNVQSCNALVLEGVRFELPVEIVKADVKYDENGRLEPYYGKGLCYIPSYAGNGRLKSFAVYYGKSHEFVPGEKGLRNYLYSSWRLNYHKNGKLKEVSFVDKSLKRRTKFTDSGQRIFDEGKSLDGQWTYQYDASGSLVERFIMKDRNTKLQSYVYKYDSQKRLSQCDYFIGSVCVLHESFDSYGNQVEHIEFSKSGNGNIVGGFCIFFEYFDDYNYRTETDDAFAQLKVGDLHDTVFGHQYVDMGLPSGNLWATSNMGTFLPVSGGLSTSWTKVEDIHKASAPLNGLRRLSRNDDTVSVSWGGAWCLPTYADFQELLDYCKWAYIRDYKGTGISYYRITGPNSQSMILPVKDTHKKDGGVENYWTANCDEGGVPLAFNVDGLNLNHVDRKNLAYIRPVIHKYKYIDSCMEYRFPDFKYPSDRYYISPDCLIENMPTPKQDSLLSNLVQSRQQTNTEYVDLGLSVLWAKCNFGASDSLGLGTFCNTGEDVVASSIGHNWRMPTSLEFKELLDSCSIKYCKYGILFTSKVDGYTNKSIMLPFVLSDGSDFNFDYLSSVVNEGLSALDEFDVVMELTISNVVCGYVRPVLPKKRK